jgi:predicted dehydrogenase
MVHAPGLAVHPGVEFVGVWGRNPDKAAALAGEYGARAYPTVDGLISDVDAIAVALPPDVQASIALTAARAGKHLLLDKPVAFTVAEADAIAAAVAERDLASAVFFTRRFVPQMQEFIAQTQKTDGWVEARVDHVGSIFEEDNPFGASRWRRESGGLWDVGPHALALVLPVLGPVIEVAAMVGPRDITHLLLRHASEAVSTLTLSIDAPSAAARQEAVFAGKAGVVAVPAMRWDPVATFGRMLDELLAAVDGGPQPQLDVRFGAGVTAVLAAAEEAVRTGRTVRLSA